MFGYRRMWWAEGVVALLFVFIIAPSGSFAQGRLFIGWATTSITPEEPVALAGQFHTRIAEEVRHPVTATALALETRKEGETIEQAIMVSCDLVAIREGILEKLRERVKSKLSDLGFDTEKLILNATHTHTAPVMEIENRYDIPEKGVMQPAEYVDFLVGRLSEIALEAWDSRTPGGVSWGLDFAVVGHNRRAVYYDGRAEMYGTTNTGQFSHVEGPTDHAVPMLFFWDEDQELTGIALNVSIPSQVVEGESYISADFWHFVREELRRRYSEDLFIYPMTGAAGDQSPHLLYREEAEQIVRERRYDGETTPSGRDEAGMRIIADRLADAVDDAYEGAARNIQSKVVFEHEVEEIDLPVRKVTRAELELAKEEIERLSQEPPSDTRHAHLLRHRETVERFSRQSGEPYYQMELHAIRLGDVALATNPFELFTAYGTQMKARSEAVLTFVIQLANTSSGYLPTVRAVVGGGYSATIRDGIVGPKGGRVLVNRTVELINSMWESDED